jgi:hypothetical protein
VTTTDVAADSTKKQPIWQRHRSASIAVAVVVVALIAVISDLPTPTTRASDISAESSVMSELNSDLQPCAYAIHQALGIWTLQVERELTAAERAPTPGLLSDDESACSFTNESTFDLTNIEVPGTAAGKQLGDLIATATLWTTSDGLRAIEDVQTLLSDPKDAAASKNLTKEEGQLASDRRTGLAEEAAADHDLDTRLQPVDLPREASTANRTPSAG